MHQQGSSDICGRKNFISFRFHDQNLARFNAWSKAPKAGALGQPEGEGVQGGGRGVKDGGTHVYLWPVHVALGQNYHNIVK